MLYDTDLWKQEMAEMCILEIHIDIQVTKDTCIPNIIKVVEQIEGTEISDMINVIEGINFLFVFI